MADRDAAAQEIVEKYVWWAAGAGLVPIPILDMAAITAVDVKMIKELSDVYGVAFTEERGKAVVVSLAGGVTAGLLARSAGVGRLIRMIPLVGQTVGALSMSLFGGAFTYAIGRVYVQHLTTGGTLLDFEPEKARAFIAEEYQKGKRVVLRRREPASAPAPA